LETLVYDLNNNQLSQHSKLYYANDTRLPKKIENQGQFILNKKAALRADTKIYNIIKCTNCDILYISPIPLDLSKIYPDNYYSYSKGNQGIIYKIKNLIDILFYKRLLKIINKRDDISILDIGGGNGSILNIFKKITKKVCKTKIIDISESSKKEAEEHGHTFCCGRVEEYFSEEKFDIILLLNLIEHLPNPLDILSKCKNLLNDDGIIVIQTPNYESLDCKLFRNFNWAGFHTPRHFILFNEKSIKKNITIAIVLDYDK
jgi:2-polyprenyl-3-methyl-5-hydroxy-6-metoxy-1,4-benzoquinol methylase